MKAHPMNRPKSKFRAWKRFPEKFNKESKHILLKKYHHDN